MLLIKELLNEINKLKILKLPKDSEFLDKEQLFMLGQMNMDARVTEVLKNYAKTQYFKIYKDLKGEE